MNDSGRPAQSDEQTPDPTATVEPTATNESTARVYVCDCPSAQSVEELANTADIIIRGSVERVAGTVNTTMDPDNPEQPHAEVFGVGRMYEIRVDEYFKGTGPSTVTLVQNEGYVELEDLTQEQLEDPSKIGPMLNIEAVKLGTDYVFFLRYWSSDPTSLAPVLNPYRFALIEGRAKPEGNIEGEWFIPEGSEEELLSQLRSLGQGG